jgi:streptomycin 6-kinase
VSELFRATLPIYTTLRDTASGRAWLDQLPRLVDTMREQWSLTVQPPYPSGSCSWVAPVTRAADGASAVLKLSWPHREAAGEADALLTWDGHGAIRLLAHDPDRHALLLERCQPGTELAEEHLPADQRLLAGCAVLRDLWSVSTHGLNLESLTDVMAWWAHQLDERRIRLGIGYDPGLLAHGSRLLRELPTSATRAVVLHGDINPGNILAATRAPWLAIDPKPMFGDPAYDPVPLVEQIDDPYEHPNAPELLRHRTTLIADTLGIDADRILAWSMARNTEYAMSCADDGDPATGAHAIANARTVADLLGI